MPDTSLREDARAIWDAAVAAVDPFRLVRDVLNNATSLPGQAVHRAARILVVGGGKAGAAMATGVEEALVEQLDRVTGWVNVPAGAERPLRSIQLHAARPAGSNHPTEAGVAGVHAMLERVDALGSGDLGLCLLSGGGSALMPAPYEGLTLADKQRTTLLLHERGATIQEMNCVRKHLSAFKGGRLAQRFAARGCPVVSLILSDVVGDPLDVIASGPTAADPTTFADALAVLDRCGIRAEVPPAVVAHLERGAAGLVPETLKVAPPNTSYLILGSNSVALAAAQVEAERQGYPVLNLGSFLEGDTTQLALAHAGLIRSIRRDGVPMPPPVCILSGGETTVTLPAVHGQGGRNQEFALAVLVALEATGLAGACVLSGGTDGEDGPTDAAGAMIGAGTWSRGVAAGLDARAHLSRHDAYPFFKATGDLLRPGLTGTNVMDVRVLLVV
jgi:hydroxypyruvate reductase/glycerate 2-kinase